MDNSFQKNVIHPSDPLFQYDKEVDFDEQSKKKSNWDSDGSDEFW